MNNAEVSRKNFNITKTINGYLCTWDAEKLSISVTRLSTKHNETKCELLIETTSDGHKGKHLHQANFNLSSSATRKTLAKNMAEKYQGAQWDKVLEQLCVRVLKEERTGEPVQEIYTDSELIPIEYVLDPILQKNKPTMIYGYGGTFKSWLGLLTAMCVLLPWHQNPYRFGLGPSPIKTLYLDWEDDKESVANRLTKLRIGMDLPGMVMNYRFCALPIFDEIEEIKKMVDDSGAGLVVIDSVGVAVAGDLNKPEIANKFASALRQLRCTVLLIHHTSKGGDGQKTPFGSVYFTNNCRSVWEIKKAQEEDDNCLEVALFQRKSNNSKLHPPIGFKIEFDEGSTKINSCRVEDMAEMSTSLSTGKQILITLRENGKMTLPDICAILSEIKAGTIRGNLKRLRDHGEIQKIGDEWCLLQERN